MMNFALGLRQRIGHWRNGLSAIRQPQGFRGPLSDVKSLIIITAAENGNRTDTLNSIKNELKNICPKVDISVICHHTPEAQGRPQNNANATLISADGTEYITDDDLDFWFGLKNENLAKMLKAQYDMAIVLNETNHLVVDFLAPYVMARLRIGVAESTLAKSGRLNFCIHHDAKSDLMTLGKEITDNLKMMF